ncbi:1-phosphatidylinositol 4-kinase [Aphelenchoides bicaudatus]|nr:1-phosphatidylinositol 4-kinase [Aphelenchoides bicaudatus]
MAFQLATITFGFVLCKKSSHCSCYKEINLNAANIIQINYFGKYVICTFQSDIHYLIGFWKAIYNDQKCVTKESFRHVDPEQYPATIHQGSYTSSNYASILPVQGSQTWHANSAGYTITTGSKQQIRTPSQRTPAQRTQSLLVASAEQQKNNCLRKGQLLLILIANEIERLNVWLDPLEEQAKESDPKITEYNRKLMVELKQIRKHTRFAWDISPEMAVHLASRFRALDQVRLTLQELIRQQPESVSHMPEALPLFLGDSVSDSTVDGSKLTHVLTWARCSPIVALSLLCPGLYSPTPATAQYAVDVLRSYPPDVLILYIQQLVQCVRWDNMNYVAELIIWLAGHSQLLAHQLLWNMQTNMFTDEESKSKDPIMHDPLGKIVERIESRLEGTARRFKESEFELIRALTEVSGIIKPYPKGDERKKECLKALSNVQIDGVKYLPSNPDSMLISIDYSSASPMQSAAKAPYLAVFKMRISNVEMVERTAMDYYRQEIEAEEQKRPRPAISLLKADDQHGFSKRDPAIDKKAAIFKVGDDVRQDMLALQFMRLMKNICDTFDIDVQFFPYRVVATSSGCGVIECVPDSKSRDQLGRQTDISLFQYFVAKYGDENSEAFRAARRNFVRSMAAYSVFSYLLQIKDRHNGNIMINSQGHIIHIDFGFLLESSPGGNLGFEPDFKLSQEMFDIMGHKVDSAPFKLFSKLCIQIYLALRPYYNEFIAIIAQMIDTKLPCFRGRSITYSKMSELEAARNMQTIISNCLNNVRSNLYDKIQYIQNDIPY